MSSTRTSIETSIPASRARTRIVSGRPLPAEDVSSMSASLAKAIVPEGPITASTPGIRSACSAGTASGGGRTRP
ncbi:MAG: hypothetical protein DMF81_05655 [Acidobacteria bacterium]|nr:MAG: hypothetical protein DMF81_05655 [Acidobacteriota bacterium]